MQVAQAHAESGVRIETRTAITAQRSLRDLLITHWSYVSIAVLMLALPRRWFLPGSWLMGGDEFPFDFLNPGRWLAEAPFIWNFLPNNVGGNSFGGLNFIIIDVPNMALSVFEQQVFHLPAWASQQVWFGAAYVALGLIFVGLLRTVFGFGHFAAFGGAVFYCINFYTTFMFHDEVQLCFLIFAPLLCLILYMVITQQRRWGLSLFLFGLVTIASSRGFANPVLYITTWLTAVALAILGLFARRYHFSLVTVGRVFIGAIFALLCNLWWLGEASFVSFLPGHSTITVPLDPKSFDWVMARDSLLNLTTLNSPWYWPSYFGDYAAAYSHFPLGLLLVIPAFVAWLAPVVAGFRHRRMPPVLLALSLANLGLLFLAKGMHEPFGGVNEWLYRNVPLFIIYRDSDTNFVPPLLVGLSIQTAYTFSLVAAMMRRFDRSPWTRRACQFGLSLAYLTALLGANFPLATGQVFDRHLGDLPILSNKVHVPDDWMRASAYLNERVGRLDGAVLVLPIDTTQYMGYGWYYGVDTLPGVMLRAPVFQPLAVHQGYWLNGSGQMSYERLLSDDLNSSQQIPDWFFGSLDIRYVLVRSDVRSHDRAEAPEGFSLLSRLQEQRSLKQVAVFGTLMVFQTDVRHGRVELLGTGRRAPMTDQPATGTAGPVPTSPTLPSIAGAVPPIQVQSANPTVYQIDLPARAAPAWLVLNDVYSKGWVLVPGGGLGAWLRSIGAALHPIAGGRGEVNGYANGWYVPAGGQQSMSLVFWPQAVIYVTWVVSLLAIAALGAVAWHSVRSGRTDG